MTTAPHRLGRCVPREARPDPGPAAPRRVRPPRPRLVVVAPAQAEAVRFTGGWLFDRAMAGWEVTVFSADRATSRPLRILGARAGRLETLPVALRRGPAARSIAVHADLYGTHLAVRRIVLDALREGAAEARFWGHESAAGPDGPALSPFAPFSVGHRLSAAARAFKAQALSAASIPDGAVEPIETFWTVEPRGYDGP
ncbi:hypothetical protein GCM10010182_45640 [Actinomadura cremea]|nr:hypothetical protein GCM10010182_45640 [Actinomadura cremea]